MSGQLADPGHVGYVRRWLAHNGERIAAVIEPPGPSGKSSSGADFVQWLENLLDQHQRVCQQEFDRSGGVYHRYTGD
jgi:hypothetical protein